MRTLLDGRLSPSAFDLGGSRVVYVFSRFFSVRNRNGADGFVLHGACLWDSGCFSLSFRALLRRVSCGLLTFMSRMLFVLCSQVSFPFAAS